MADFDFESLILTEAAGHLTELAIDYVIDQFTAEFGDRGDDEEDPALTDDVGPTAGFKTWEEFFGLDPRDEWVTGAT